MSCRHCSTSEPHTPAAAISSSTSVSPIDGSGTSRSSTSPSLVPYLTTALIVLLQWCVLGIPCPTQRPTPNALPPALHLGDDVAQHRLQRVVGVTRLELAIV